jgi:hypothetical protein
MLGYLVFDVFYVKANAYLKKWDFSMTNLVNPIEVFVIIATAYERNDWLINRCLRSVYKQLNVDPSSIKVIIVDDNEVNDQKITRQLDTIKQNVAHLRKLIDVNDNDFQTVIIQNARTKGFSGTGAWNTGIFYAYNSTPGCYISILDDDDEYLPNHLYDCSNKIKEDHTLLAVFQSLCWKNHDNTILEFILMKEQLSHRNFFIGNPGVQGSNMFFRSEILVKIGAFNENYPSATDRDLMIRFLQYCEINAPGKFAVIENPGVVHYNHDRDKVNNDRTLKTAGLDMLYKDYRNSYSDSDYQLSLERAQKYFSYLPSDKR